MKSIRKTCLCILAMTLGACASSAPPLPEDTTSTNRTRTLSPDDFSESDAAKSCTGLRAERDANNKKITDATGAIEGNRSRNVAAVLLGGFLILPYATADANTPEKEAMVALNKRQDTLRQLWALKHCS